MLRENASQINFIQVLINFVIIRRKSFAHFTDHFIFDFLHAFHIIQRVDNQRLKFREFLMVHIANIFANVRNSNRVIECYGGSSGGMITLCQLC